MRGMSESHKHPSAAFWATVVVVLMLVAYPLSLGPAIWLRTRPGSPTWVRSAYWKIYAPIVWIYEHGPEPIKESIDWYGEFWVNNDE
jgi:hypothetical protein